jgi:hypothetical protein
LIVWVGVQRKDIVWRVSLNNVQLIDISSIPLFASKLESIDSELVFSLLEKLEYFSVNDEVEKTSLVAIKNYNLLNDNNLNLLKLEIEKKFNYFIKLVYTYECQFKIVNSWATKTIKGINSVDYHTHTNSMFTAVYYPKGGENYADLILDTDKKRDFFIKPKVINQYNSSRYYIKPQDNELIIFPSNISHRIGEHLSDEIRYSIAVNFMPIGKIGSYDSYIDIDIK